MNYADLGLTILTGQPQSALTVWRTLFAKEKRKLRSTKGIGEKQETHQNYISVAKSQRAWEGIMRTNLSQ